MNQCTNLRLALSFNFSHSYYPSFSSGSGNPDSDNYYEHPSFNSSIEEISES